jgi:hypothetical protein
MVSLIDSGAATDKLQKYTYGSNKVAITTGPLGLQHELITQFAADFTNYKHHNTDAEELAQQLTILKKLPSAPEDTSTKQQCFITMKKSSTSKICSSP